MKHGITDVPVWPGQTKYVRPTAETTISLSQIEVGRLFVKHVLKFLL